MARPARAWWGENLRIERKKGEYVLYYYDDIIFVSDSSKDVMEYAIKFNNYFDPQNEMHRKIKPAGAYMDSLPKTKKEPKPRPITRFTIIARNLKEVK